MTGSGAKSLTVVSLIVSGSLASVESIRDGHLPPVRLAFGGLIAGVVLFTLADAAPDVAGGLAGLLLVGSLLTTGSKVLPLLTVKAKP